MDSFNSFKYRLTREGIDQIDLNKLERKSVAKDVSTENGSALPIEVLGQYNYSFPHMYRLNGGRFQVLNLTDPQPKWKVFKYGIGKQVQFESCCYSLSNNKFYVCGGIVKATWRSFHKDTLGCRDIIEYNLTQNTTTRIGKMKVATCSHSMILDNFDNLLIIGGFGVTKKAPENRIEIFNLVNRQIDIYYFDDEFGELECLGISCYNPYDRHLYIFAFQKESHVMLFLKINLLTKAKVKLSTPDFNPQRFGPLECIDKNQIAQISIDQTEIRKYDIKNNQWQCYATHTEMSPYAFEYKLK
ncbi:hypothetical protein DLAC_08895 [Tieghemostelium lacteum]|uniref:Uncharacterized protein n=1 Tax=Tieghemostelium lacteum TaxID=361077 RepID=A0A151Z8L4_TIELA|nr:hypothetical protein DLAC_08895 [Tieghemostelium lacteum]|eukprot:KYQ90292.1 hypothetical protein DLAC_08895 [Tieghemostelium lacteum]